MWLLIRTSLAYDRNFLLISLLIPAAIGVLLIVSDDANNIDTFFIVAYIISLIFLASTIANDKRERLYTHLPLTRLQIAVSDCIGWLIWTGAFYGTSSFMYFAAESPIPLSYFVDLLGVYLFIMANMALFGIAFILANFRDNRFFWAYLFCIAIIIFVLIIIDRPVGIMTIDDQLILLVAGYKVGLFTGGLVLATSFITAMYMLYMKQDSYLK